MSAIVKAMRHLAQLAHIPGLIALFAALACSRMGEPRGELVIDQPAEPLYQTAEDSAAHTVALVLPSATHPLYSDIARGAHRAAVENSIPLTVMTGSDAMDGDHPRRLLDQLIARRARAPARVGAVVVDALAAPPSRRALARARDAGLAIIGIGGIGGGGGGQGSESGQPVPSVGNDDELGAYLTAKYLADRIAEPTRVAILQGSPRAPGSELRARGALRAFADNPNITVVAREAGEVAIDGALELIGRLFDRHPDLGALFCASDTLALAAVERLRQTGNRRVLVASYGGQAPAKSAVAAGALLVAGDRKAEILGYKAILLAGRAARGEAIPGRTLVDVDLVTAETPSRGPR